MLEITAERHEHHACCNCSNILWEPIWIALALTLMQAAAFCRVAPETYPMEFTLTTPSSGTCGPIRPVDEDELIAAAKRHESRAFELLMRRYNRRLFRVARSILRDEAAAEDAVQECYIRAFMNLSRYRPTGSFGAWLTRLAINESLMLKRRSKRSALSLDEAEAHLGDDQNEDLDSLSTPDAANATSTRQLLEHAIDALPQPFRTVFVLRVVEQLSTEETAACLAINEATVKTRLHRAHARLRADIERRLRREHLTLFDFAGERCDRIVAHVLRRLSGVNAISTPNLLR
jgi:RNA polymerase sigma-70 factor, ECF subfamily